MQPDDVYPNDSTHFMQEPAEQTIARKKEKAKTLEALDVIKNVVVHFDKRIADRDSIEAVKVNLEEDPLMHQKKCEVNEMLKLALEEEKQMLEELLDIHAR